MLTLIIYPESLIWTSECIQHTPTIFDPSATLRKVTTSSIFLADTKGRGNEPDKCGRSLIRPTL